MKAGKSLKVASKDFSYTKRGLAPLRLRKLYWQGPLVVVSCIGTFAALAIPSVLTYQKFQLVSPFWLGIPSSVFVAAMWAIMLNGKKRRLWLEEQALEGLPNGWHLIYRYHWFERRCCPELVFETEFDKIAYRENGWFSFLNGEYLSETEKSRLVSRN